MFEGRKNMFLDYLNMLKTYQTYYCHKGKIVKTGKGFNCLYKLK